MNLMLWLGWTTSPPPAPRAPAEAAEAGSQTRGPAVLAACLRLLHHCLPPLVLPSWALTQASCPRPTPGSGSRLPPTSPPLRAGGSAAPPPCSPALLAIIQLPRVRALPCGVGALEHLCAPLSSSGQRRGWHPQLLTEGRSEREADLRLPQRPPGLPGLQRRCSAVHCAWIRPTWTQFLAWLPRL